MSVEPGVDAVEGLVDSKALAARLGVSQATVRSWRKRGADWLPAPVGRLDGLVWRESDVQALEAHLAEAPRPAAGAERRAAASDAARSDRLIAVSDRRARGAYYTPGDAAHLMARWLVRRADETYLEPSMGDGVFVEAVDDVAAALGLPRPGWAASELDADTARAAVSRGLLDASEVRVGDFLDLPPVLVDAVIANPPYVRLRHLDDRPRDVALRAAAEHLGAPMAPSGSLWMPFVLRMTASLRLGGRMAVVLPLDVTYVAYARPLWAHLARSFSSLRVVRTRERVFGELNQDVVILFADGHGGATEHVAYETHETVADLAAGRAALRADVSIAALVAGDRAFQHALLSDDLSGLLAEAAGDGRTVLASQLAAFRIGYVAGDKTYFHPSAATVAEYRLPASRLRPSLVNARKLRGHGLRTGAMEEAVADHLWLPTDELTPGERRYIRRGEQTGVSGGYKARIRTPWYRVPGVRVPDALVTVFSERPLLLVNDAEWVASNSLLCVYTHGVSAERFAVSWYSPLTLLSIGLEVHSLGGGVMVMVPNEASRVAMLAPALAGADSTAIERALRAGDIRGAYDAGAESLAHALGSDGVRLVQDGIDTLARWRTR